MRRTSTTRTRTGRTLPDAVAVTALGHPEEPSKADLLRAFEKFHGQVLAQLAEFRQMLNALPDPPSPARAAEPLPPRLDEKPPMRGFLVNDPD